MESYITKWRKRNPKKDKKHRKTYAKKHKESEKKRSRERYRKNPKSEVDRIRPYQILYKHGITQEVYNAKLESQNNICGLCHKPFYGKGIEKGSPVLDHSHLTGKHRDFIHRECNTALGLLKEDPATCLAMAEYLKKHIGDHNVRVEEKSR